MITQTDTPPSVKTEGMRTLLLVDDDAPLLSRLARAMERRGFEVRTADSVSAGIRAAESAAPDSAVVDLRLGDGNGLDVVAALRAARADTRIVMLTGYGAIATAVAPVKARPGDYPPKPAHAPAPQAPPPPRHTPPPPPPPLRMSAD